jgi:hypothetical protein
MSVKTVTKQIEQPEYHCDFCDKIIDNRRCIICERNICDKHIVFDNRDYGDYPDRYCKICWYIGEPYRAKMKEIEIEAEKQTEELNSKWIAKAKEKL